MEEFVFICFNIMMAHIAFVNYVKGISVQVILSEAGFI